MANAGEPMSDFPRIDCGFFHLTPEGWSRRDREPFPADRVETWRYEMFCPAADAKERVCLTRIWSRPGARSEEREILRARFGTPLAATPERNVTLECQV
jgi:hypothetical protein